MKALSNVGWRLLAGLSGAFVCALEATSQRERTFERSFGAYDGVERTLECARRNDVCWRAWCRDLLCEHRDVGDSHVDSAARNGLAVQTARHVHHQLGYVDASDTSRGNATRRLAERVSGTRADLEHALTSAQVERREHFPRSGVRARAARRAPTLSRTTRRVKPQPNHPGMINDRLSQLDMCG